MEPRRDAERIFLSAVRRVDPEPMVERFWREGEGARLDLGAFDRVYAVGMGKASARMASGLERALGDRLAGGVIAVKEGHVERLERLRLIEAGHPVPDERSERAAAALLGLGPSLGRPLTERDLVVVLVSGGGSAILCAPAPGLTLADKAETTRLLLGSGATIHELNCVRKHLSAVKGGRLAAALAPASILTLVLSDVIGDDLDTIASGPTVPDSTSFADAMGIVVRYGLAERLPPAVIRRLEAGVAGRIEETPKPGDAVFARARHHIIGSNRLALEAAREEAERLGYDTLLLSSRVTGEAREVARVFLGIGKDIAASGFPLSRPACVVAGGETTVSLKGHGRGGRNQEMALAFLDALQREPKDAEGLCFLSAGTDGNDGPTDAAGACVDLLAAREADERGLDPSAYLADNDSYTFFKSTSGLVVTGPTNTNVCDVQVLLIP